MWCWKATLCAIDATGVLAASAVLLEIQSAADGILDPRELVREHPAPGTPFWIEVIESFNAKYQGDTAGHIGRGDEVWVDLNPADPKPPPTAEGSPASGGANERAREPASACVAARGMCPIRQTRETSMYTTFSFAASPAFLVLA